MKVCPIILAGGVGTRLWPLSRKSYPKQFARILDSTTLFQKCVTRLQESADLEFSQPIIVTHSDFRFTVVENLQKLSADPKAILLEPEGKNTAAAILAATLYAHEDDPDSVLLVAPSDHVIPNAEAFRAATALGYNQVLEGKIVTFGIRPSRPETGYGYLMVSDDDMQNVTKVDKFIEKPDIDYAQALVDTGKCFWNSGIFMFRAKDMIKAFSEINPTFIGLVDQAIKDGAYDFGFFRLDPTAWQKCDNISIDHAIMEHAQNLVCVPFSDEWSDLGEWGAVLRHMEPDDNGVAVSSHAHAFECKETLLRSESSKLELVGLGLENIIAIAMPDAVLVANRNHAKDLNAVVSILKGKGVEQSEIFPKDYRPWGWYEVLHAAEGFKVKIIRVNAGASLSLQSHKYRSEHWIVVEGIARVTLMENEFDLLVGQSTYIPVGNKHRLENYTENPLRIIEVQCGHYLEEDDITRYDDVYTRN